MNKFKFLSCAVMAAFFAMGITSCEKEDFNTKVDIDTPTITIPGIDTPEDWKPGNAVVAINPSVIAVIDGAISDVTGVATVTYNGEEGLKYTTNADGSISAFEVKLEASYLVEEKDTTLTAAKTVKVPALSAGQALMITPTLVITANFETEEPGTDEPGTDEPGTDNPEKVSLGFITEEVEGSAVVTKKAGEIEFDNPTNYYYTNVNGTTDKELLYGTFISNIKVVESYKDNTEVQAILGSYNQGVEDYKIGVNGFTKWPNTLTCFTVEQIAETKDYIIKELFETRATTETTAATFTVTDYSYIISTTPKYYDAGTGHGHGHSGSGHAHSHGDGHGNSENAGGGIVVGL